MDPTDVECKDVGSILLAQGKFYQPAVLDKRWHRQPVRGSENATVGAPYNY